MRTFQVSNEMYERLKEFVVDPFDDTPEAVIGRLIEIANKAKSRWSPFDVGGDTPQIKPPATPRPQRQEREEEESAVVL